MDENIYHLVINGERIEGKSLKILGCLLQGFAEPYPGLIKRKRGLISADADVIGEATVNRETKLLG
jgi:hypothetical protein